MAIEASSLARTREAGALTDKPGVSRGLIVEKAGQGP